MREKLNIQMIELTDEEMTQIVGGEFAWDGMGALGLGLPLIGVPFVSPLLAACGVVGVPTILPTPFIPTPFTGCFVC
jgi:bacteriocin-like protein